MGVKTFLFLLYRPGNAFVGKPAFDEAEDGSPVTASLGQRQLMNQPTNNDNELYVDKDIMVLANPEIANLPAWVVGLVAAGVALRALKRFEPGNQQEGKR